MIPNSAKQSSYFPLLAASHAWLGAREELGRQLEEQPDRQPDHIGDAALEPLDQGRAEGLNRIAPRAPPPLAELDVALLFRLAQLLEDDSGAFEPTALLALGEDDEPTEHLVRAARQAVEVGTRFGSVSWLAKGLAVEYDVGVAGDDESRPIGLARGSCRRRGPPTPCGR